MTKFRCRNHRLPVEAGYRAKTESDLGYAFSIIMQHNMSDIGDEYHCLLCCPLFREARRCINNKLWKKPSTIQVQAKRLY